MSPTSKPKQSPPDTTTSPDGPLTFEKVWLMFQETDKRFKDTDRKFQETDLLLREKFKETDKKLNKLEQLFTSQWGKLVESLVEGDILTILNQWGIEVTDTIKRRSGRRDGVDYEFDIIAINGSEIVIIEVKTTLRPEDIRNFLKKLKLAKNWMPEYADKKLYGAVPSSLKMPGQRQWLRRVDCLSSGLPGIVQASLTETDFNRKAGDNLKPLHCPDSTHQSLL